MASLKEKTISGIFWSFLQKIGSRGISFIVTLILARVLTPADFGLIGMMLIFIQISQTVVSGGFKQALIQKTDTDEGDYSSVFYINLIVGAGFYLLLYFGAPFIANFYSQPKLGLLIRVFALLFVINAFGFVQEARLTKDMDFRALMKIQIPSVLIGGAMSIAMAFAGFGVWSIVTMQLMSRLTYVMQIWIYAKWRPARSFSSSKASALFSFGSKLLISQLINTVYNNSYLMIVGRFFSVASVGYFSNAFNLSYTPSNMITSVVAEVTFPAFSSLKDNNERLKAGYRRAIQQVFFWVCPLYVFAAVLAVPIFEFLFTEKWLPAVPFFRWLCIGAILQPLIRYNSNVIAVKGYSGMFLKLQIMVRLVTIASIVSFFSFGITALLITQAGSSLFAYILFSIYSSKYINYTLSEQILDILPILLLSTFSGVLILFIDGVFKDLSLILRLVLGLGGGLLFYGLLAWKLRLSAFIELLSILQTNFLFRIYK